MACNQQRPIGIHGWQILAKTRVVHHKTVFCAYLFLWGRNCELFWAQCLIDDPGGVHIHIIILFLKDEVNCDADECWRKSAKTNTLHKCPIYLFLRCVELNPFTPIMQIVYMVQPTNRLSFTILLEFGSSICLHTRNLVKHFDQHSIFICILHSHAMSISMGSTNYVTVANRERFHLFRQRIARTCSENDLCREKVHSLLGIGRSGPTASPQLTGRPQSLTVRACAGKRGFPKILRGERRSCLSSSILLPVQLPHWPLAKLIEGGSVPMSYPTVYE